MEAILCLLIPAQPTHCSSYLSFLKCHVALTIAPALKLLDQDWGQLKQRQTWLALLVQIPSPGGYAGWFEKGWVTPMRVHFQLDFMMISVISEQGHGLCLLQSCYAKMPASLLQSIFFHEVYILGVDDNIFWIEKGHISDGHCRISLTLSSYFNSSSSFPSTFGQYIDYSEF